jgi:hypothetical protein
LKSDPDSPNYYEWRFSPEYPAFPPRSISNWALTQIKECYNAIESGALYIVDTKNRTQRTPKHQKHTNNTPAGTLNSNEDITNSTAADRRKRFLDNNAEQSNAYDREKDPLGERRQLVNATEAAFTHYIGA